MKSRQPPASVRPGGDLAVDSGLELGLVHGWGGESAFSEKSIFVPTIGMPYRGAAKP